MLWTVHDRRLSVARQRKLSLPNLCRLFEYRWRSTKPQREIAQAAGDAGRAFLQNIYPHYDRLRQRPRILNGNGE